MTKIPAHTSNFKSLFQLFIQALTDILFDVKCGHYKLGIRPTKCQTKNDVETSRFAPHTMYGN